MTRRPEPAPRDEGELLGRAEALAGLTLGEIARARGVPLPAGRGDKGWSGELLEDCLGADAGSRSEPDFRALGVELKTLPIGPARRPLESTYVCTVPLEQPASPRWEDSAVCRKLSRVLWVPLLTERGAPVAGRRLGAPLLWSPTADEARRLRADWEELMALVTLGRSAEITAHHGALLQIRPKAANARARRWGTDAEGRRIQVPPRGFYLRPAFTASLLERHYAAGSLAGG